MGPDLAHLGCQDPDSDSSSSNRKTVKGVPEAQTKCEDPRLDCQHPHGGPPHGSRGSDCPLLAFTGSFMHMVHIHSGKHTHKIK